MNEKDLIKMALSKGFKKANVIDTKEIVFDPDFRQYCEENLCGQYGANYSCPPDCGTPEEMKREVLKHRKALVLQTMWEIGDFSDEAKIDEAKNAHNSASILLLKQLREIGYNCFLVGLSSCNLCNNCKIKIGKPCVFPEQKFFCMSAYCIYVKKLADFCQMDYAYKDGLLPFFGMIIFD